MSAQETEPTVIGNRLYFTAAGASLAEPGCRYWMLAVPLADGRELIVHMGDELRQRLRIEPAGSDGPQERSP